MHPDTLAAVRLLVLALESHPEDIGTFQFYGGIDEHLADLIHDYTGDGDDEDDA